MSRVCLLQWHKNQLACCSKGTRCSVMHQGSYRSWKTWKVVECMISISRPGKSWNSCKGCGKSWKNSMLLVNKRKKDKKFDKMADKSETGFNFSVSK